MDKRARIEELVETLNKARYAYEQENRELISNFEYDALYDELLVLEDQTGIILSDSPTQNVGFEVVSNLEKKQHSSPMLSQDKTKSIQVLTDFIHSRKAVLSLKMDGLTVVIRYKDGKLCEAITRGNGYIGEVVTHTAKVFDNLPKTIEYKGELLMRGEAIIKYDDFNAINDAIADPEKQYKNPRNLCSGSVRQLNNEVTKDRHVNWIAFSLVNALDIGIESIAESYEFMAKQGFDVVDYMVVESNSVAQCVEQFKSKLPTNQVPSDGLILIFDDIAYGNSLGFTSKFPRNSIAFKWKDETQDTILRDIEWSASKTGLLNPVAIFDPVELEGTTVKRASLHNVSIIRSLKLGIGDTISVYKANMIIPQIAENKTKSDNYHLPRICPACGKKTSVCIDTKSAVATLICENVSCPAKSVYTLSYFASRDAMNIVGISENEIATLIELGVLTNFLSFYELDKHKDMIVELNGWGEKSYNKLIASIESSKDVNVFNFLNALSVPGVGLSTAKLICKHFGDDISIIANVTVGDLIQINGIGESVANSFVDYMRINKNLVLKLASLMRFKVSTTSSILADKTFVITGSLNKFSNRNELVEKIESLGGKVASSVSKNTSYLINNDNTSQSSKNKKANELGISIITEEDFNTMIEE